MLLKSKYTVSGYLKLSSKRSITHHGRKYDLDVDEKGFLSSISITIKDETGLTPQIEKISGGKVSARIGIPHVPEMSEVLDELRTLEGLLSLFGLREIDVSSPLQEWIPETPAEKDIIGVNSFKFGYADKKNLDYDLVPFELVERNIIASSAASEYQVALSFYRKGCIDIDNRKYIDAFYDFFFVFESVFGGGKFKTDAVKNNFSSSLVLVEAAEEVLKGFHPNCFANNRNDFDVVLERYHQKAPTKVLEDIVDMRGFLHHHSGKRKKNWHPERQCKYKVHALFCQEVAFKVCSKLVDSIV